MNDLEQIIKQAEADVQEYEALVASAEARVVAAQTDAAAARGKLSEGRIVLDWLRRRGDSEPVTASPPDKTDQPDQADQSPAKPATRFGKPVPEGPSKLAQCLDGLEGLGGAASNKQISNRLRRDGIIISPEHVRGLLKYASTKKPALVTTEHGSGVWRLVRSPNGAGGAQ